MCDLGLFWASFMSYLHSRIWTPTAPFFYN